MRQHEEQRCFESVLRKVRNSQSQMQGLTVSETYDLITAVHDGLETEELPKPGGQRIEDAWFSSRALQHRLVAARSWQECRSMYARIRPFLERAYAKAKQGDILDISFVEPLCQALRAVDEEDERGKQEEEHRDDEEEELSRDEEVKLLNLGLLLCDASVSLRGDESNVLLGRRDSPAVGYYDYRVIGFLAKPVWGFDKAEWSNIYKRRRVVGGSEDSFVGETGTAGSGRVGPRTIR